MAQATRENQAKILKNQAAIVRNQSRMLANQKEILANQRKILGNQKKILGRSPDDAAVIGTMSARTGSRPRSRNGLQL